MFCANPASAIEATVWQGDELQTMDLELDFSEVGGLVAADLGSDGVAELIVSSGFNEDPNVSVLRQDGSFIGHFVPYGEAYKRGITVAAGDVDGDGVNEIVTGTMIGGGPHVRVFDNYGRLVSDFFAYDIMFRGGANVSTADIDGDGTHEIITAAGLGGGPHVKAFDLHGNMKTEFFAFDASDNSGISTTSIDSNTDGRDEIVVTRYGYGNAEARVVSFDTSLTPHLEEPFPVYTDYSYGSSLFSVNDVTFGVSPNGNGGPHVKLMSANGSTTDETFVSDSNNTLRILSAHENSKTFSIATAPTVSSRLNKHIYVDIDEQRLYAYDEGGILNHTYLISSGLGDLTPQGEFAVMRKLRWHDYIMNYGEDDPRNYNIQDVEYNLEFTRHYYIHYAYWHSNWGHRMSHGCVNAPYEGVRETFNWAEVGTPVIVEED